MLSNVESKLYHLINERSFLSENRFVILYFCFNRWLALSDQLCLAYQLLRGLPRNLQAHAYAFVAKISLGLMCSAAALFFQDLKHLSNFDNPLRILWRNFESFRISDYRMYCKTAWLCCCIKVLIKREFKIFQIISMLIILYYTPSSFKIGDAKIYILKAFG